MLQALYSCLILTKNVKLHPYFLNTFRLTMALYIILYQKSLLLLGFGAFFLTFLPYFHHVFEQLVFDFPLFLSIPTRIIFIVIVSYIIGQIYSWHWNIPGFWYIFSCQTLAFDCLSVLSRFLIENVNTYSLIL